MLPDIHAHYTRLANSVVGTAQPSGFTITQLRPLDTPPPTPPRPSVHTSPSHPANQAYGSIR